MMGGLRNLILLLWIAIFLSSMVCMSPAFVPKDNYLINCGSSTNTNIGERVFAADNTSPPTLSTPSAVLASTSSNSIPPNDAPALYQTARIFTGPSSYKFPIRDHRRHWIRLYFFPFKFQTYDMMTAKFSVSTDQYVLLENFQVTNDSSVVFKEYSVNITSDDILITFAPSDGSFAFINAIEVVSVPDELISDTARTIQPVGTFDGLSKYALETVHRVNMGIPRVSPSGDSLSRTWVPDRTFLLQENLAKHFNFSGEINYENGTAGADIAPRIIYSTCTEMNTANVLTTNFNVTWVFPIDPGFSYLVRMHFADIVSAAPNELYFNVYINSMFALRDFDISSETLGALAVPYYADYVVDADEQSRNIRVSIGPSHVMSDPRNAIMNGLEIMKVNNSKGSLDGLASVTPISQGHSRVNVGVLAGSITGVVVVIAAALFIYLKFCRKRNQQWKVSKTWVPFSTYGGHSYSAASKFSNGTTISSLSGFRFSFVTLQEATNGFEENSVIGVGGFGKVYKGVLRDGTKVAVKRGNPQSQQGLREFRTEIEMLSKFRHRHLVSLIGYCDERNEMILVYEYMENGTLKSHLYGEDLPSLSWKQRLEICIGAARGLHYLHTGSAQAIIHRDVKSANILLDENLMAKVADFGLSKAGPELDQTHVSTAVKGSFGYLDPEYFRRQQLTEKSDVYSFGVVLLEVLCARAVIDPTLPREMVNIAEWAMKWQKKGQLDQIIDHRLVGQIKSDSLRKFGDTIEKCLADYGVDRPTMGDVLWNLEYALQLQEAVVESDIDVDSMNQISRLSPLVENANHLVSINVEEQELSSIEDLSGVSMSRVFSQLVKAEGR